MNNKKETTTTTELNPAHKEGKAMGRIALVFVCFPLALKFFY